MYRHFKAKMLLGSIMQNCHSRSINAIMQV